MTAQKQMTEKELDQISGGISLVMTNKKQGNSTQWSEICDVGTSYKLKNVILTSLHKKGN
jgi:bacteriocin-like protein